MLNVGTQTLKRLDPAKPIVFVVQQKVVVLAFCPGWCLGATSVSFLHTNKSIVQAKQYRIDK